SNNEKTAEYRIQNSQTITEQSLPDTLFHPNGRWYSLCEELASLLQEAMEMKWPFVPEKWQYKRSVSTDDKTNLSDLIGKHLPQILAFLKASIMAQEAHSALAVVFLVDRFLYWIDESSRLLKIARLLHKRYPDTPIAPQLVIRHARVFLNSGKLQKAEYILSSLINNSGTTGCWKYHSESDRALVQAVSVQVRGMILQKLGLWLGAAELIWASLVGYYSLPQPDKKGIGTSLGILANILVSMNDEDFKAFRTNQDSLLGDGSHRLLSAAQAAKMAVVYSQYTSLYVLTNVVTQGTCLLSYSFSVECPAAQRQSFLLQAREAFAVGLLTKAEGDLVTSKQELHTFLKAAYSLTVTHKWLGTPLEIVAQASQACHEAVAIFYKYCLANTQNKENLCAEIMHLVAQVKLLLQVEPFPNSDKKSFIPDSYRNVEDASVNFTLEGFSKTMQELQKNQASLCETNNTNRREAKDEIDGTRLCITALGTTVSSLNTECSTEACRELKDLTEAEAPQQRGSDPSFVHLPQKFDLHATSGSKDNLPEQCAVEDTSTGSSFEMLEANQHENVTSPEKVNVSQRKNLLCHSCLYPRTEADFAPTRQYLLSERDYQALLAGVCHECLLQRLQSDETQFKLKKHSTAYSALNLKFSKATGLWTARETCVYIGEELKIKEELKGRQRSPIWVQFLHQEERLSSYVGKDYLKPKHIHFYLKDVERQMTAQYYVTEFNKSLYEKKVMAQIFYIPSEALLLLNGDEIVGCVTVEPYMLGDFVKLTNNTVKTNKRFKATEYGLAFGHFTYHCFGHQEVVVDLQGWVTANGKGLTYLTDPQIHSTRIPRGNSNHAETGIRRFWKEQHGPKCNEICQLLKLKSPPCPECPLPSESNGIGSSPPCDPNED
uniref:Alpha kinase 1 n=1 Tax=Stegastes partitus TaxID=144197 RepID=A0A3B4ZUY6_9TELE